MQVYGQTRRAEGSCGVIGGGGGAATSCDRCTCAVAVQHHIHTHTYLVRAAGFRSEDFEFGQRASGRGAWTVTPALPPRWGVHRCGGRYHLEVFAMLADCTGETLFRLVGVCYRQRAPT